MNVFLSLDGGTDAAADTAAANDDDGCFGDVGGYEQVVLGSEPNRC